MCGLGRGDGGLPMAISRASIWLRVRSCWGLGILDELVEVWNWVWGGGIERNVVDLFWMERYCDDCL